MRLEIDKIEKRRRRRGGGNEAVRRSSLLVSLLLLISLGEGRGRRGKDRGNEAGQPLARLVIG
jgi:hypothetical protein